jgi:hypothetical protein
MIEVDHHRESGVRGLVAFQPGADIVQGMDERVEQPASRDAPAPAAVQAGEAGR